MGWADCGEDSTGRPIGYAHEGFCDHLGCDKVIGRGLAYACGGMHGAGEFYCEMYFCSRHLYLTDIPDDTVLFLCEDCSKELDEVED